MERNEKFFPPGIAKGHAFCNRENEKHQLKQSIENNEHIVLISPRRYGKTSLILQLIHENAYPHCAIDFLPATNQQYIKNAILTGVGNLVADLLPSSSKTKQKLLRFFENMNPKIILSALGQRIELSSQQAPPQSILEALLNLDQLAGEVKKHVVFLMDEFQQIGCIHGHHEIEASIRHAVERSQHTTYFFSGSNRHILEQMFNDKKRPLYHLCRLVKIERIGRHEYLAFLQKAARKKWGTELAIDIIDDILNVTECHTYYINYLCRQLWKLAEPPTLAQVQKTWKEYVNDQLAWITDDVGKLSANQRIVLAAITLAPEKELQSQAFSNKVKLQPASIKRALETLLKDNFIYQDHLGYYHTLDPAIAAYLRSITFFGFDQHP